MLWSLYLGFESLEGRGGEGKALRGGKYE